MANAPSPYETGLLEDVVAKLEWGTKRTCTTCGARFYDMNREPVICPKCGAENEKDAGPKLRRGGKNARNDVAKKTAPLSEGDEILDDEVVLEGEDGEDDSALIEDASDLGEDEDMSEVIEGIDSPREEE